MSKKQLIAALTAAGAIASGAARAADPNTTTVGGRGYFDVTNIDETSDGVKTDASGTSLDAKRFYFILSHQFDKIWSANFTTDFNYVSNDSETQVFVKKAYFEGKFSDAFTLRVGSADVPLVPFVEGLYGNRFIENVLVEHLGIEASADWGMHILGSFGGGKAHYAVSALNGAGYKTLTRSQTMDLDGRIDFEPVSGLTLALFYRTGKRGLDKESVQTFHNAQRSEFLAAYVKPKWRVGAEYFNTDNWNTVLTPVTDSGDGYSLWGQVSVAKNVALFARYDDANPSKDLAPTLENKYYNLGVDFQPIAKNLDVAIVYKRDQVDNGTYKTSNGTIGGVNTGKHDEFGVWMQVQF